METYGDGKLRNLKGKTIRDFKCGFCGYEFKQYVDTSSTGRKSRVSTQIKCRECGNFLPTFK